jgi:hypothetical protein
MRLKFNRHIAEEIPWRWNILGVSKYTGISVYCNTEEYYIVSRYKRYILVIVWYIVLILFFLVVYKTLIRITLSSELLPLFTKICEHINHFSAPCMPFGMHCSQVGGQHSTWRWISVCIWSFSVIRVHGNILQYVLWYGCHVLQYIAIRFCRIMTPLKHI